MGLGRETANKHPSQMTSELKQEQIFLLYVTFCAASNQLSLLAKLKFKLGSSDQLDSSTCDS